MFGSCKIIYVRNSLHNGRKMLLKLSKVTSKGQITILAEIRKALDLAAGDTILFEKINGNIIIKRITKAF